MMGNGTRQRRRTKVINGRLQYRIIAITLVVVLAAVIVFAGMTALYIALARLPAGQSAGALLLVILPPLLLNDLVIMIFLIIVGIVGTNKIAGPAYRMESDVERALAGERNVRVRLRRGDAFPELAEKVNKLLESIDDARGG